MNVGARVRNAAAGAGVVIFAAFTVSPFATKLLAKEPLPMQQKEEKITWNISLSGSMMKYNGKRGAQSVETGTILIDGQFATGVTGKPPSEIVEKDLFAGGCSDNVFVMVGAKGIGAIWVSTSANAEDKIVFFALPFTAESAKIDPDTGVITVKGPNGEEKKYRVLRSPKNQPQLIELKGTERK